MYSKQQSSQLRSKFWTSFGQYMRPLPGVGDEPVNWLNYKTGIKHLYFRMDADNKHAIIAVEMRHPDPQEQLDCFDKFRLLKPLFHQTAGENWDWELHANDEDEEQVSRISTALEGVNVFNTADWPAIISFLKPRIIALDHFWKLAKESFY